MPDNDLKNVKFDLGGTFSPTGCVTAFFDSESDVRHVASLVIASGSVEIDVSVFDPPHVAKWAAESLDEAGVFSSLGYGIKILDTYKELADAGKWFIIVRAPSQVDTERVMQSMRGVPFMAAHKFHTLTIEDLS